MRWLINFVRQDFIRKMVALLLAILLASVLGSIVLVAVNRLRNQDRDTEYPFGPFLVGGILLALLAGEPIITWYLGVLLG